jgi:hypothetical protein
MAVTFVTAPADQFSSGGGHNSATSNSFTPSGTDLCVIAGVGTGASGGIASHTITKDSSGGTAYTNKTTINHNDYRSSSIATLVAPGTSSQATYVAFSPTQDEASVGDAVYAGVDQTTPIQDVVSAKGTYSGSTGPFTATVNVPNVVSGETLVAVVWVGDNVGDISPAFTKSDGYIRYDSIDPVSGQQYEGLCIADMVAGSSGTVAFNVTFNNDQANSGEWSIIAGRLKEASAAAATPFPPYPQRLFQRAP